MIYNDFKFEAEDKQEIFVANWSPEKKTKPKAVVQLAHGMAEHIGRYSQFATFLNNHGYIVFGNDHRGAGKTAGILEHVGFLAESDGFQLVVNDLKQLTEIIREKHPGLPVFLFGHSMGSLLVRDYITESGAAINGAILSGTPGDPGMMGHVGEFLARMQCSIQGKRTPSRFLNNLTFGAFNSKFKPNRTEFDWLSRDQGEVDKYIEDPYCGNVYSSGFFLDLFQGTIKIFKPANQKKTQDNLPLYIFSGDLDPVGGAKSVPKVYQSYLKSGLHDVTLKLYPGGRHEMLNEINREEVFADVLSWLDAHLDEGS